jgi:hypothetical protein
MVSEIPDPSIPDASADILEESSPLRAEIAALREGLTSRTVIGQATGLLAGRFDIPIDTAWQMLCRTSNLTNLKLRDISRVIVGAHDGELAPEDHALGRAIADALPLAMAKRNPRRQR